MARIDFSDWLYYKKNTIILTLRALKKYYFFGRLDIRIGHNVFIRRGKGKHSFGSGLVISDNSIFETYGKYASITIGDKCFLSYGVVVACTNSITFGNNVWIGEYTSIRDATHTFSIQSPLGTLPDKHEAVKIGNNVWIGKSCIVLPGSIIEDNVIIAANSVVKGHCKSNSLYGGCPARFIKEITE